jgi:saccharopine dehydrogenase-like NADP-dependent oxidoreductase
MSGFGNFIIAGSGTVGSHIARELLQLKDVRKINSVAILTRSVSFINYCSIYRLTFVVRTLGT